MPLPFLVGGAAKVLIAKAVVGAAAVAGATGAAKGVKGAMDTKEAKDVQGRAEWILDEAKDSMDIAKEDTSQQIIELGKTKLSISGNEIKIFVKVFSKIRNVDLTESIGLDELRKLNITEESLEEMEDMALSATDVLQGGIAGVGAGALLGWGTYGGVMALGTASTGAGIAGLTGAAASNATLAWLGGGALTAGGGGMALGTAVLGGIVAGPALLIAGGVFGSKAREKLNNAYSNLAEAKKISEELKTAEVELMIIKENSVQYNETLKKLSRQFNYSIAKMDLLIENEDNWNNYSMKEKELVAFVVKFAQLVKKMIDQPLLTEDGVLVEDIKNLMHSSQVKELLGEG